MHDTIINILTFIHFLSMAGLACYGIHRLWMIWSMQGIKSSFSNKSNQKLIDFPKVIVQIPIYNESHVAGRIINAVAAIDWPDDKLLIQVLDDSDDETIEITKSRADFWRKRGKNISIIQRKNRDGYKAGALKNGLEKAECEFVAVFDADFVPNPDFLKKMIRCFEDEKIGMVQGKWTFLNEDYSWLTKLQALLLSAHFSVEHKVRFNKSLFFNFNGTAGIWRKKAIEDAGGWESDTVTEDLDLSYRAQLKGWRFVYLDDVCVPSELPVTLVDFRSQQERWSKGSIQTAKKLLPGLILSSIPISVKVEAVVHLLANCCWVFGFSAAMTLYPVLLNRIGIGVYQILWIDFPLFLFTGGCVLFFYGFYGLKSGLKFSISTILILPAASIGLAPFFSLSVVKGLVEKGGVFKRTPKFGITGKGGKDKQSFNFSGQRKILLHILTNTIFFSYMMIPVLFSLNRGTWPALPFLSLFPIGFLLIIICDVWEYISSIIIRNKSGLSEPIDS